METSLFFLLFGALFMPLVTSSNEPPLGSWNIDQSRITVSGFSAGGAFSTQFHVAYSSIISGMGSWAGIANTCYVTYGFGCMNIAGVESVEFLLASTDELAAAGRIDDLSYMATDLVYIMHGTQDSVVDPDAAVIMNQYYENFVIDPSSQIVLNNQIASEHCVQSEYTGTACGNINTDIYIEDCDFDSPFNVLNHIVDGGINGVGAPGSFAGELLAYDQDEFFPNNDAFGSSMDEFGYVYVPPNCIDGTNQCLLHVHFHGCLMYSDAIGTDFILASGFLELADANDMVVLFPQNIPNFLLGNFYGCFDWFEYTNSGPQNDKLYYATQEAPQMDGVYQMIQRAARLP